MINLKEKFGKRFKVTMDESWDAEIPENKALWKKNGEIAWYYEIHGKWGHIYPQKENAFAIGISPRIQDRYNNKFPFEIFMDRGQECVHEKDIDAVIEFIKPRKRRILSPEQKLKQVERLRKFRYSSASGERGGSVKQPKAGGTSIDPKDGQLA